MLKFPSLRAEIDRTGISWPVLRHFVCVTSFVKLDGQFMAFGRFTCRTIFVCKSMAINAACFRQVYCLAA